MATLAQLAKLTPNNIRKNAGHCRTRVVRSIETKDDDGFDCKQVFLQSISPKPYGSGKRRNIIIRLYGDDPDQNSRAVVWCPCEYFLYFLEVADTIKASSFLLNSNGKLPVIRNPKTIPYLCKHLYSSVPLALKARTSKKGPTSAEKTMMKVINKRWSITESFQRKNKLKRTVKR